MLLIYLTSKEEQNQELLFLNKFVYIDSVYIFFKYMVNIGLITITNLRPVAFSFKYLEKFRVIFNVYFSFNRLDMSKS